LKDREHDHQRLIEHPDFDDSIMPPPEAVEAGKVAPLTDEDRRTLVRWVDLGCPIDLSYDPQDPRGRGDGWMLDDQRPTLTLTSPRSGAAGALTRILIGMHDYGTGLNMSSFSVTADFELDGHVPGENLAGNMREKSPGVWEWALAKPVTALRDATLTVSVADKEGNVSRIERKLRQ
jgi:hypothetical protein